MRFTIIVRFLGRAIGFKTLQTRIQALWKPVGEFQLIDLDNSYFLVRMEKECDYVRILTDGPWTIFGSYLTVQPWTRAFSTTEKYPSHVIVWVRLPGLPYKYYTKTLFDLIASVVGKVIRVDYNTQDGDRGKFARLAVMVDLNKPLLPCLGIDGHVQKLEYEGLQSICFKCGVYGHLKESCGVVQPVTQLSNPGGIGAVISEAVQPLEPSAKEPFGPWMQVSSRRRKTVYLGSDMGSPRNRGKQPMAASGSRFASLAENNSRLNVITSGNEDTRVSDAIKEDGRQLNPAVGQTSMPDIGGSVVLKNAAYKASNPEKWLKSAKLGLDSARVVPIVHEKEPVVSIQGKTLGNEHHKAALIVEQSVQLNGAAGGKIIKERGVGARNRPDGVRLDCSGVRFRKINSSSTLETTSFV
ncbi:hypothetical protein GQ457_13G019170 [Hibiscus cannabinus]